MRVVPSDSIQHVLIEMLPPVLVLHLRRFRCDAAKIKIGKHIPFVPELEIPPGTIFIFLAEDTRNLIPIDTMVPTARQSVEPVHYTLYGVLYHHGESAGSGHYSVDVLRPNWVGRSREAWLHIDVFLYLSWTPTFLQIEISDQSH